VEKALLRGVRRALYIAVKEAFSIHFSYDRLAFEPVSLRLSASQGAVVTGLRPLRVAPVCRSSSSEKVCAQGPSDFAYAYVVK